jgi:hypothetical protein
VARQSISSPRPNETTRCGSQPRTVTSSENSITIDGKTYKVTAEKDPAKLPWKELGVDVAVGDRIGADVAIGGGLTLRAYLVSQTGGTLAALDHGALRWVDATELLDLAWVPADRAWLGELRDFLGG